MSAKATLTIEVKDVNLITSLKHQICYLILKEH